MNGFQCEYEALVKSGQPKVTEDANGYDEDEDAGDKGNTADFDMLRFKVFYDSDSLQGSSRPDLLQFEIEQGKPKPNYALKKPPEPQTIEVMGKKRKFFGYRTPFVYVYRVVPSLDITVKTKDGNVLEKKHFVIHTPVNSTKPAKVSVENADDVSITGADQWAAPKYPTIASVLAADPAKDPLVKRRLAVLALVFELFPCSNNAGDVKAGGSLGKTYWWEEGKWKDYRGGSDPAFVVPKTPGVTDCTKIAGDMMYDAAKKRITTTFDHADQDWRKDTRVWAFGGPKNKGWVGGSGQLPSVGDTYILNDKAAGTDYGHVGIIMDVPQDGNGLWVTADGGQGGGAGSNTQIAYFVPRWGMTGDNLPTLADPTKAWPPKSAADEARPWLGNDRRIAEAGDIAPDLQGADRIAAIKKKIAFMAGDIPNPRRVHGYVDLDKVDAPHFDVVDAAPDSTIAGYKESVTKLQGIIATVRTTFLQNGVVAGAGVAQPGVT